jgi:hypothetical protein
VRAWSQDRKGSPANKTLLDPIGGWCYAVYAPTHQRTSHLGFKE